MKVRNYKDEYRKYGKPWKEKNREKHLVYMHEYNRRPEVRERQKESNKKFYSTEKQVANIRKYRKKYPERVIAANAINHAVQRGQLERQACLICGSKAGAHHPDYSKPKDVIWLCPQHHKDCHLDLLQVI